MVTTKEPSEHAEQVGFLNWFKSRYPGVMIIAIPNGGKRDIRTATKLKAEGVLRGVPDLFIPAFGTWIEMKKPGGKLSPAQKDVIAYLKSIGHTVIIGFGAEDASKQVLKHMLKR